MLMADQKFKELKPPTVPCVFLCSGQDVATILHLVHNLIHEEEEEEWEKEDRPNQQ